MVDPTTINTSLAVPVRGSNVGTWDVPVNDNTTSIDAMFGGITTIIGSSVTSLTLATSQAKVSIIRVTGTLTSNNLFVTLPGIYKSWMIDNQLTNSPSSFALFFNSSGFGSVQGIPAGTTTTIFYDGSTVRYADLGKVGEYWDYAGTTVPTWSSSLLNTKAPYLNCDGTAFSSATYPILANLMGNVLPDARGRNRYTLNQGTARLSTAGAGIDGNTYFAAGGNNGVTLGASQIPTHTSSGTITVNTVSSLTFIPVSPTWFNYPANDGTTRNSIYCPSGVTTINSLAGSNSMTYTNSSQAVVGNASPGYVGGITMIRSA